MMKRVIKNKRGISLIEVVIASAIILTAMVGLVSAYNVYLKVSLETTDRLKATLIAEETLEAIRFLRDKSWDNIGSLSPGTEYYLYLNELSGFEATTTPYGVDKFERKFTVSNVERDVNDDITDNGANDAGSKLITATVSWWVGSATTTKTLSTYITDLF